MSPERDTDILFERVSAAIATGKPDDKSRRFAGIADAAQPFFTALLARDIGGRIWIVCPDVKRQEDFAAEMAAWSPRVRLFPDLEIPDTPGVLPDPETASERLVLLCDLACGDGDEIIVLHEGQLDNEVPPPASLRKSIIGIATGARLEIGELIEKLEAAKYERVATVGARGQYAQRGGIVDVFSWQQGRPVRIEWFDEEIESVREFDVDAQTSLATLETCEILSGRTDSNLRPLRTYFGKSDLILGAGVEPEGSRICLSADVMDDDTAAVHAVFYPQAFADFGAGDLVLDEAKRERFFRQLREWDDAGWTVALYCNNEGEWERFRELAADFQVDPARILCRVGPVTRGFTCPAAKISVLADAELFGRSASQRMRRASLRRERMQAGRAAAGDFSEFEEGDYVVHLDHGIGRYVGLQQMAGPDGIASEVLALEFAEEARLFVPLDQAWNISRYVGVGKRHPELSNLGDDKWQRLKSRAQRSVFEYAARMLRLQAERETSSGFAFPPDGQWQREFEASFLYKETKDQMRAIEDSKADMESQRPMDRLICGDVGFGKTEVAIRAVFKAVTGGRQAAVIAPTTVLAQQHFENFKERMSDYPLTIELLSRYRTAAEQRKVIGALETGGVDVVIGTHRIISSDVRFKDLGLVVVDEEQRFGVKHKEALKDRFRLVDILTLSATPIPRTLYLALMGARDMSVIETPPPNRQPVETVVCGYDERIIRDAVKREIARGGQVYFLHNRVGTIGQTASRIQHLCPGVRVAIGHGQMNDGELEVVMKSFVEGKADVLVSTTIIESGLDIPNANTIIIDRADRFGLADLYQLRGRVGRSRNKAYAYLMLPRDLMGGAMARKRVSAIKQYSELGAGFKIAMRDLEIRGAGNLLGTAQSGHIVAVGFDLYCKMLKRAVDSAKGGKPGGLRSSGVRIDFLRTNEAEWRVDPSGDYAGAFIPAGYVDDPKTRIECHRRVAEAEDHEALDRLGEEWRDRFGRPPVSVENVLVIAAIRLEAGRRGVDMLEVRDSKLMLSRKGDYILIGGKFPRLTNPDANLRLRDALLFLKNLASR